MNWLTAVNTRRLAAPFSRISLLEIRGVAYLREHLEKAAASGVRLVWGCLQYMLFALFLL